MNKLYGTEAVFIFDPKDNSNVPVRGYHDNALAFWLFIHNFSANCLPKAFLLKVFKTQKMARQGVRVAGSNGKLARFYHLLSSLWC